MLIQKIHHRLAEGRQVERGAAGDEITVHHDGLVFPETAGVFEVVLDAE
jgi:hypothetical protein